LAGIKKTIGEFEAGKLHSGSKEGPIVKSLAQARAIGLSEERKEGHKVAMKHEPTAPGHMGKEHDHHVEQGHMVHGPKVKNDGAGRHGADESGHMAYSEHKQPHHPAGSHTVQGYIPAGEGVAGHPGDVMKLAHDGGKLIGGDYQQSDHEPAVLKHEPGPNGWAGLHAGLGTKPSGYGHQQSQREGVLRNSGHPQAHRIGKRD
jgi:Family of unknown function (DUF6496)